MQPNELHLSRIQTNREVLGNPESFFAVYSRPIQRFFSCLVNDANLAEDLFQDFAVNFVTGTFANYDPDRGRFRDYLKASLRNQAKRQLKKKSVEADRFGTEFDEQATRIDDQRIAAALGEFDVSEGRDIRKYVAMQMKQEEARREHLHYSLIKFLFAMRSEDLHRSRVPTQRLVDFFLELTGEEVTPANAKQRKSRALAIYAQKILAEIRQRFQISDVEELREAAAELGLLVLCEQELEATVNGTVKGES